MRRLICTILLAGATTAAGFAKEYAILQNGFRLEADRHEVAGEVVKLYTSSGVVEMPAGQIVTYEQDEYVPPPPAPAPAVVATASPASTTPHSALTPKELIDKAAKQHGLPPEFLHSVARAESAYQQKAVSPKGAIGIMQLMPSTAAALKADPKDAEQNVDAGARLLRDLLMKYEDRDDQVRLALAAYNAGEGAVARYHGIPPYRETQQYVEKIVKQYLKAKKTAH